FPRSLADEVGQILLDAARRHLPEAVPVRFGAVEPLQHHLERDGDAAFLETIRAAAAAEYSDSISWAATPPCLGGHVGVLARPRHGHATVSVGIDLDGRALDTDGRWTAAAIGFFEALARRGAFYGVGYVNRGVVVRRGRLGWDGESEKPPVIPI